MPIIGLTDHTCHFKRLIVQICQVSANILIKFTKKALKWLVEYGKQRNTTLYRELPMMTIFIYIQFSTIPSVVHIAREHPCTSTPSQPAFSLSPFLPGTSVRLLYLYLMTHYVFMVKQGKGSNRCALL